ncbi:HET-domain-containing protein [Microthyrium microscopicum]|uniref:HET-domain-containing protein n=1 Tax=Microthyrium microscopicum TaxID=703497 RepID=A0A6A6UAM5_9PEZI|nr:HET-domain-containing protein [Microthyrium microscopicum]
MNSSICQPCREILEQHYPKRVYRGSRKHLESSSCPFCHQISEFFRRGERKRSIFSSLLDHFRTIDPDAFEIRLSLGSSKASKAHVENTLKLTAPSFKTGDWNYIEIVAEQGTEAATFIPDRPVLSDTISDSSFSIMKSWITICDAEHENCHVKSNGQAVMPRRLLKLDATANHSVQLVEIALLSDDIRYTALSYCWGNSATDQQVTTTLDNLQDHTEGISVWTLPKAIQDAILVSRKLEIPYLWIDALCIVQDDTLSKKEEIKKMGYIYSNAQLTIAASNTSGCGQNFLRPGDSSLYFDVLNSHDGKSPSSMKMSRLGGSYPNRWTLDYEPLHKRGWTFQEMMLSKRIIFFSNVQPYWKCKTTTLSTGGPTPRDYFWHTKLMELMDTSGHDTVTARDSWPWLVSNYSQRTLGDLNDKVGAIHAIRNAYERPERGTYLCGLWTETLHIDLAWKADKYSKHQRNAAEMADKYGRLYSNNQLFLYPTYSWLYYDGAVTFPPYAGLQMIRYMGNVVTKDDEPSREIELLSWPEPDDFGNVNKLRERSEGEPSDDAQSDPDQINESRPDADISPLDTLQEDKPLVLRGRSRMVLVPTWTRKPGSSSNLEEHDNPGSPHVRSCYDVSIWDLKKKRFKSHMTPYWQYEIGKINFDYFDDDVAEYMLDENFGTEPLFLECLLLCTTGPLGSRTYSREGPHGTPQQYRGPMGRQAYALVLFPSSTTKKNQRKRIGLMSGVEASAFYFNGGREVQYELF